MKLLLLNPNPNPNPNNHSITNASKILLLDLDNTLYPKSSGLDLIILDRIRSYFNEHLQIPFEESIEMAHHYYHDYGLSIKGLIKNSSDFPSFTPKHYDSWVNEGLPLEEMISSYTKDGSNVKDIIKRIRKSGILIFIFTNSSKRHLIRTLECLKIIEEIEGAFYCDYEEENFPSKPDPTAFQRVEEELGRLGREKWDWKMRLRRENIYFVDDSVENIRIAKERGWKVALIDEDGEYDGSYGGSSRGGSYGHTPPSIKTINDLLNIFPELEQ